MHITITARHFELTKAIRDHVEDACEKLERYFDQIVNVQITLALENSRNIVEIALHAAKFNLQSNAEEMDMYVAIDLAIDKMEHQIKKLKDKVTDHQKRSLKDDTHFVHANLYERKDKKDKIIRTKRIPAEIMTVEEAIAVFEKIEDNYFIFKNMETDRVNVLVRNDNNFFKLIEA